jgi:uncharacterized protein
MRKSLITLSLVVSLLAFASFALAQSLEQTKAKAEKGDAAAQSALGSMYAKGEGVAQDWAQAKAWFEKAAAQGNAAAQFSIGFMYAQGQGIKQDRPKPNPFIDFSVIDFPGLFSF